MQIAPVSSINARFTRVPTPVLAMLELTHKCNWACFHCIRDCNAGYELTDALLTEDWLGVLDELAELNCMAVSFTGGEATIHPDIIALIRHARKRGMSVSLKTNGMTLATIASELKAAGVQYLEVSVHGATAEAHDRCTQVPGSFDKTIAGIREARRVGIPVVMKSGVFRWNAHELLAMRELAGELDCPVARDYSIIVTDRGRLFDDDFVTVDQIREIERLWPVSVQESSQNGSQKPQTCAQGMNTVAISSDGEILSCIQVRKPLGRLAEMTLTEAWRRYAGRAHSISTDRLSRCASCELLPRCVVCVGRNESSTGSFYEPPLERCFITMSLYGQDKMIKEVV